MREWVWKRGPWHLLTAMMLAATIGWAQPAGANNSDDGTGNGAIVQTYEASFVDGCAIVSGEFRWSPTFQNILITGTLSDSALCGELRTTVTFTAYTESYVLTHTETADDVQRAFSARLSAPAPVDRIALRLCRVPLTIGPASCIPIVVYRHP